MRITRRRNPRMAEERCSAAKEPGNIFWSTVPWGLGCEQSTRRPSLMIAGAREALFIPISSSENSRFLDITLEIGTESGLDRSSHLQTQSPTALPSSSISSYIGTVTDFKLAEIKEKVRLCMGLHEDGQPPKPASFPRGTVVRVQHNAEELLAVVLSANFRNVKGNSQRTVCILDPASQIERSDAITCTLLRIKGGKEKYRDALCVADIHQVKTKLAEPIGRVTDETLTEIDEQLAALLLP